MYMPLHECESQLATIHITFFFMMVIIVDYVVFIIIYVRANSNSYGHACALLRIASSVLYRKIALLNVMTYIHTYVLCHNT